MVFGNDSLSNMYAFFQIIIVVTVVIITNIQENDLRIENVTGATINCQSVTVSFLLHELFLQIGKSSGRVVYNNNVAACAAFKSK